MVCSFTREEAPAASQRAHPEPIHRAWHCSWKPRPHPGHFCGIVAEAGTRRTHERLAIPEPRQRL